MIISADQTIQFDVMFLYMGITVKDIVTVAKTAVKYLQDEVLGQKVTHYVFKNQIKYIWN